MLYITQPTMTAQSNMQTATTTMIKSRAKPKQKPVTGRNAKSTESNLYPHLWRWAAEFGTVEIGHCSQTRSFIRVLDEGGIVWKGLRYLTLDAALADAEAGVSRWMIDQLGIRDAA